MPNDRARVEPALAVLHTTVAAAAVQAARADGQAMALDAAIAYALDMTRSIAPRDI